MLKNCILVNSSTMIRKMGLQYLFKGRNHFIKRNFSEAKTKPNSKMLNYLIARIKATGPMTVADYMKEVLTSPTSGYYMNKDVFGSAGDFITSPEISQMFGELIGIWFFNQWCILGKPQPLQFVELGPGRGTLAEDILRVFSKLGVKENSLSLHLVEISPHLCKLQKSKLCFEDKTPNTDLYDKEFSTKYNFPVTWYPHLKSIPEGFSMFLAHEFFDALPIHKFQKTPDGWREILIDFKEDSGATKLHYVISRGPTPASEFLIDPQEKRDSLEVSAQSCLLLEDIFKRMKEDGGISLIIDYGHCGTKGDTFRSFQSHLLHDPLQNPGEADLTADVDFSYLKKYADNNAITVGPVTQRDFLKNMGIDIRLKRLLQAAKPEHRESLQTGYDMLTNADKMGERYKFFALFPLVLKDFISKYVPPGFS